MISRLSGIAIHKNGRIVTLDVNGVGYEVHASRGVIEPLVEGDKVAIVVFTDVKEDSITLFGFKDQLEKQTFLLLKKVKGLGSKTASEIISKIDKLELLRIIGSGDSGRLQLVKGIGKKLSERIIVELRDIVAQDGFEASSLRPESMVLTPFEDAIEALVALGFPRKLAEQAVSSVRKNEAFSSKPSGEIVREALRFV